MATAFLMAQQVFSSLGGNACLNATAVNGTAAQGSTGPMEFPTDFSSLISFLLSASALSNWLKLALFGSLLETCRRLVFHFYYKLYNSIFITARFEEEDSSYNWMMLWLAAQPSWRKARDVQISTRSFGLNNSAVMIDGEDDDPSNVVNTNRQLAYIPSLTSSHSFWYNKHWVRVTRSQQDGGYYGRKEDVLELCIMSLDHSVLNSILREAKKAYMAAQEHMISVYVSDTSNNWRHIASRPKRPLNSIVLDPGIKDLLIDDARDFLESKGWYAARGIPFRRGYLLYGAPGSGKTSIIHSLAGELGLDVYVVSLSRVGMDDTSLGEIIAELPEKCIALMEDIDAAFSQTLNRDEDLSDTEESNDKEKKKDPRKSQSAPPTTTSRVTLSGLLNALDGVGAQEGRILFATTNKYTSLDPALCRPGRMDIHIEFKLASRYQARELYRCFYLPDQDDGTNKVKAKKEKNVDDDGDSDSGYSTISEKEKESCPPSPSESSPLSPPASATSFSGSSHRARPPKLSLRKVDLLADRFAAAIPEREFSMAALQGYLMAYKVRPIDAVRDAAGWVEKERAERISKSKFSSNTPKIQKTEEDKEEGKAEAIATPGEEISS